MAANSILVIVHVDEACFGEWVVFLLAKPCIHLPMQSDMAALIWCTIPQVCYCLFILCSRQTSENTFERSMCAEDQVIAARSPMGVGQLCLESSVAALVRRFLPWVCHSSVFCAFL